MCGMELTAAAGCKYAVFDNAAAVIEGHKGIAEYSTQKVCFCFGRCGTLEVCGAQLKIKCLERHFAVIVGKITSVSVKNG